MNTLFRALVLLGLSSPAIALEANAEIQVQPLLKTSTSWDGTPLHYPSGQAEITALKILIAPKAETGWHQHPVASFGMVVKGELEVELRNGKRQRFKAGDLLAEVINTPHNGHNVGTEPLELLVFYAGAKGQPLTEKLPAKP